MVYTVILSLLLLASCTATSTDTPKLGKQVEAPHGWLDTYCPSHKDEIGCSD